MGETRRSAHFGSEMLRRLSFASVDNADTNVAVWTKELDFARTVADASLDAAAEMAPWNAAAIRVTEDTVDEWFDALIETNEESWRLFRSRFEEGAESYDDLLAEYDELVDATVDASATTLDESTRPSRIAISDDE